MPIESGAPWALDDRLHILSPEKYDFKARTFPSSSRTFLTRTILPLFTASAMEL